MQLVALARYEPAPHTEQLGAFSLSLYSVAPSQLLQESHAKELYTELPIIHLLPIANRKPPKDGFYECSIILFTRFHFGFSPLLGRTVLWC